VTHQRSRSRFFRLLLGFCLLAIALLFTPPVFFLGRAWLHDADHALPPPPVGRDDASRLHMGVPPEAHAAERVIAVEAEPRAAEAQLASLVRAAAQEGRKISIAGARHSMGGHTLYPQGLVLDLLPFNHLALNADHTVLTAGAGARWIDILPYLDQHGRSVAIMQSNNDFSVGGSISVNCHGWQNDAPPISSSVVSFRLLLASGEIVRCSRTEHGELFRHALGGYGLFGVILDAELRTMPNEFYRAEAHAVAPEAYTIRYAELTRKRADVGMAYGRISVAPESFLAEAALTLLCKVTTERSGLNTLVNGPKESGLKRTVFRGGVGSDYGKNLRWRLEAMRGETGGEVLARNVILDEPAELFANRDPDQTDILHEYFLPAEQVWPFLERARPILRRHPVDLLNITVRNVKADKDTALHYAREDVFGLVFLFNQARTVEADNAMRDLTRELIDAALACRGTYYLPYRLHATREQFYRAYPQAADFFATKRRYDPGEIFQNYFYRTYGPNP
jgi:FAD/FMN-containing dehydrogenase